MRWGALNRKQFTSTLEHPTRGYHMATIVAICPYCRAGGVRAPQASVGASATCPKCKSSFTVMPSDGLPGWAKEPQPAKVSGAHTPVAEPPKPTDETKPVAAMGMADVTEPSPILPHDERVKVKSNVTK